ncbi:hypothetical protein P4646_12005 [Peribacillus simplex]|uniref:hypothetical protein n=1 Tax=Peribacillus simplex TaxID=1478 RepID=UPI0011DCD47E|nr:hypothetical protein [Peribacillus simplex]MED3984761.1 hypothetical protein [Peribacillus simplex]MED4092978.1 hypothetical protein [Peribacillus simplex]
MEEKVEKQPHDLSATGSFYARVPKQSLHPFSDEGYLIIMEVISAKYLYCFLCAISHKWQR